MYYVCMKICNTRKTLHIGFLAFLSGLVLSCASTAPVAEPQIEDVPQVDDEPPVVEETVPLVEDLPVTEPVVLEPEVPVLDEEPVVEQEPVIVVEEPPAPEVDAVDEEYARSVGDVAVSRDTFIEDKEKILQIISELEVIMKNKNYKAWLSYVDQGSIDYWKLRKNLQKAEKKLPGKGLIKLQDLQKYFEWVFIPARKGRVITEIRYISDNYINAVQIQENDDDIVCYYFNKINGRWLVHIPTNEELQ